MIGTDSKSRGSAWRHFGGPRRARILESLQLAGVKEDGQGRVVVWAEQAHNPHTKPMFLAEYATGPPHYVVTDGEVWQPLVAGAKGHFFSYPLPWPYSGLSEADREQLTQRIAAWVRAQFGETQ